MKGLRRLSTLKHGRRFPNREDSDHLAKVRKMDCLIRGKKAVLTVWRGIPKRPVEQYMVHQCEGPVEAHHVTSKGAGGHDRQTVPLCSAAHKLYHQRGRVWFAETFQLDLVREAERIGAE